ncbi:MAG: hypothetical protein AAGI01_00135 [Myxococcota bacterium]
MKDWLNAVRYRVEAFILRGAMRQLAVIALLLAAISMVGGALVQGLDDGVKTYAQAAWWAFLRLTDPGYLGDDQGVLKRVVSTSLTTLGLVIFVGALVAIMTQWIRELITRFERGLTPVPFEGHVVVLGYTDRTATILRELIESRFRVRRLLERLHKRRLRVVVLAEEVSPKILLELKQELGQDWGVHEIVLRSGEPWEPAALERVHFTDAAALIIPGADFPADGLAMVDAQTITTILAIAKCARQQGLDDSDMPLLVAELHDSRKRPIALAAYPGTIELLASDTITSYLIAQNIRHSGLSSIYDELLDDVGNELYMRRFPELIHAPFHGLIDAFEGAIPIGIVHAAERSWRALLNPPRSYTLAQGDHIVLLAEEFDDTTPAPHVLIEVNEEQNAQYFDELPGEVLISSVVEGRMLAQIALRHELRAVYDALFGPGRPEIDFRPADTYDIDLTAEHSFASLQHVASSYQEIALGVRIAGSPILNPSRDSTWKLAAADDLIVLIR